MELFKGLQVETNHEAQLLPAGNNSTAHLSYRATVRAQQFLIVSTYIYWLSSSQLTLETNTYWEWLSCLGLDQWHSQSSAITVALGGRGYVPSQGEL